MSISVVGTDTSARAPVRERGKCGEAESGEVATQLLLPHRDTDRPELSVVIPALNEQSTISEFVRWCHEGMASAGVAGEIVIVDSSTDMTAELALAAGARVLRTAPRGLGRAYKDAAQYARGRYVLMGDADCTYDFRLLEPFIERHDFAPCIALSVASEGLKIPSTTLQSCTGDNVKLMPRRVALLAVLLTPSLLAQFSGLASTADGSSLYFASTLRLKTLGQPLNGKIYVAGGSGPAGVNGLIWGFEPPDAGLALAGHLKVPVSGPGVTTIGQRSAAAAAKWSRSTDATRKGDTAGSRRTT